ncbi:hypothetical protein PIROE2DRAFT_14433 [Piromyces sp. E2]|nr:hypothetical protein PIROE2DRAFT_14433 [Piromyces sp. E2]|eukprot:OUM59910.1 hypothetical protein PIROE2DRAFT_14433 [Piromyces sp. E2]
MKYYFLTLFTSILLFNIFNCDAYITYEETTYRISDVESFKVYVTTSTATTIFHFSACEYHYFCHEDEPCLKVHSYNSINNPSPFASDNNYGEYLMDIKNNTKKIRICMINPNHPAYVCRTTKENSELKVKCLLAYEEKCKNDSECGDKTSCVNNICIDKVEPEENNFTKYFIIGFAIIFIIIIAIPLYFIIKNNIKDKKNEIQ